MVSCTFNSLPLNIAHEFGISGYCTKQCVVPESIRIKLSSPLSCTGSSNKEHSAGARTALSDLHTYFVAFFGICMHGVLLFLLLCLAHLSLSDACKGC